MFSRIIPRSKISPVSIPKFQSSSFNKTTRRHSSFDTRNDKGPNVRHFLLVGLVGTLIFGLVVHKIDAQDPAKSLAKRKNTFSEEEWQKQLEVIKRKKLAFDSSNDFYLVPFGAKNDKQVDTLKKKIGGNAAVIDLNKLIQDQLSDVTTKYGSLLDQTIDKVNRDSNTCFFTFTYKLAPGIFTKLVSDELTSLKQEDPELNKFILLNYPNTIPEAIKFEQDVGISKNLVLLGNEDKENDIVDYFKTVGKTVSVKDL